MSDDGGITIWWIGEGAADGPLLDVVRRHLEAEFGAVVTVEDPPDRPEGTYDARRRQHASREVLRWLVERTPEIHGRLLGITDVDLFIPVLTFVFGEAQLEGRAAVVSTARLLAAGDPRLTADRLAREAVHELGHTFGLLHCSAFDVSGRRARPCVMSRSGSLRAVDAKSHRLCPECRSRYSVLLQDGSHVYREHQNPHR
jgi:archaemetzincin